MFSFFNIMAVASGAVFGSLLRYWISSLPFFVFSGSQFFLTAFINIAGCAGIGLISAFSLSPIWQLFSIVGFLGSFTTFSSFCAGFFRLLEQSFFLAFSYFSLSVIGGFLCFWLVRTITIKILG